MMKIVVKKYLIQSDLQEKCFSLFSANKVKRFHTRYDKYSQEHNKNIYNKIRAYSQMQNTDKYSQHNSIIWPVWLNG